MSDTQFVKFREDGFFLQRTVDELNQFCWNLDNEARLSLDRSCLESSSPGFLSRAFRWFRRKRARRESVPDRCLVVRPDFTQYFPVRRSNFETLLSLHTEKMHSGSDGSACTAAYGVWRPYCAFISRVDQTLIPCQLLCLKNFLKGKRSG